MQASRDHAERQQLLVKNPGTQERVLEKVEMTATIKKSPGQEDDRNAAAAPAYSPGAAGEVLPASQTTHRMAPFKSLCCMIQHRVPFFAPLYERS